MIIFQDGLAICPLRIFIFFGLTISLCKAQLHEIYQTLSNAAAIKMQDGVYSHDKEIRLVQHFSGACRAARALMLKPSPGSKLLMSLDDTDLASCRRLRTSKGGWLSLLFLNTLILVFLFGDFGQDLFNSLFFSWVWSGFMMFNYLFLSLNDLVFIIFWSTIGFIVANRLGFFDDLKKKYIVQQLYINEGTNIQNKVKSWKILSQKFSVRLLIRKVIQIAVVFYDSCTKKRKRLLGKKCNIWKNLNQHYSNSDMGPQFENNRILDEGIEFPDSISTIMLKGFSVKWWDEKTPAISDVVARQFSKNKKYLNYNNHDDSSSSDSELENISKTHFIEGDLVFNTDGRISV